jgi:hypothetical protein
MIWSSSKQQRRKGRDTRWFIFHFPSLPLMRGINKCPFHYASDTHIHTYIFWTSKQILFKKNNCGGKKRYSLTPYVLSLPYGLFKNSFFQIALTCNMQESLIQQLACLPARECQVVFFHRDSKQQQSLLLEHN